MNIKIKVMKEGNDLSALMVWWVLSFITLVVYGFIFKNLLNSESLGIILVLGIPAGFMYLSIILSKIKIKIKW